MRVSHLKEVEVRSQTGKNEVKSCLLIKILQEDFSEAKAQRSTVASWPELVTWLVNRQESKKYSIV